MRSIAIYARVSSEQQAQEATIDSQVAAVKERVAADGHVLLPQDVYLDDGFSGSTLVRPALERLRDRVAEGGVDRLYVHSPDRLARKYAYQVLLLDELRKHGVTTVFLNGPSGKTAEDELLVQVQGMIAEYERAKILERSRRGKIHRARHGEISPLGCAPYGFAYVKKRDGEPASYRVLLHEAKVVREIFHAFVHEQKSISVIARELSVRKVPTRRGAARWGRPTVWTILRNPAHMGRAAYASEPVVYLPMYQSYNSTQDTTIHMRVSGDPQTMAFAVERAVHELNPELPLFDVHPLTVTMRLGSILQRVAATFASSFGLLALLLAAVGIYGVVAYSTRQRTREIGIRMALGADKRQIFTLVLRQGFRLVLMGLAAGTVLSLVLTRFLTSQLYGVSAMDPLTFATVAALLSAVTLAACYIPARRATKIEPTVALRCE